MQRVKNNISNWAGWLGGDAQVVGSFGKFEAKVPRCEPT